MTRLAQPLTSVFAGAFLLAGLVACGGATAGEPSAVDDGSATTIPPTTGSADDETSTSSAPQDFSEEGLCGLLTSDEARQVGGSAEGEPGNSVRDGHPQCQWTEDTSLLIGYQNGTQSANARTGQGITNTPITVSGHTAMRSQETEPVEVCQILVDLTPDSLIYVSATNQAGGEGKYQPCDVANQLIDIVIPKVTQR